MILRIVAGLRLHSMHLARVRDPTGSPEFTYDRTINLRISRGLSSSPPSLLPLIAFFIASGKHGVNRTVGSGPEFHREVVLKSANQCVLQILYERPFCNKFCQTSHFP